jgi:hypothetical protein
MYDFVVLDHRSLRNSKLIQKITKCFSKTSILLTSDLLVEVNQNENWETTFNNDLKNLIDFPELVFVSRPIGVLRSEELTKKTPVNRIIDNNLTDYIRNYLKEIKLKIKGDYRKNWELHINEVQSLIKEELLNHSKNKINIQSIIDDFKSVANEDLIIALGKNLLSNDDIYNNIIYRVDKMFVTDNPYFKDFGTNELNKFLKDESLHYKLFCSVLLNIFLWQSKRGFEQYHEVKVTHDLFDQNNAIIALYGKRLFTEDVNARNFYNHLKNYKSPIQ